MRWIETYLVFDDQLSQLGTVHCHDSTPKAMQKKQVTMKAMSDYDGSEVETEEDDFVTPKALRKPSTIQSESELSSTEEDEPDTSKRGQESESDHMEDVLPKKSKGKPHNEYDQEVQTKHAHVSKNVIDLSKVQKSGAQSKALRREVENRQVAVAKEMANNKVSDCLSIL